MGASRYLEDGSRTTQLPSPVVPLWCSLLWCATALCCCGVGRPRVCVGVFFASQPNCSVATALPQDRETNQEGQSVRTKENEGHSLTMPRARKHSNSRHQFDGTDSHRYPNNYPVHDYDERLVGLMERCNAGHQRIRLDTINKNQYNTTLPVDDTTLDLVAASLGEAADVGGGAPTRDFVTVYEYKLGNHVILWDYVIGWVYITSIWKAVGNYKADVLKLVSTSPDIKNKVYKTKGGCLKVQGTWIQYDVAKQLASRFCWPIRFALVPVFGCDFVDVCLSIGQPGYGLFQLTVSEKDLNKKRRRKRKLSLKDAAGGLSAAATTAAGGGGDGVFVASMPQAKKKVRETTPAAIGLGVAADDYYDEHAVADEDDYNDNDNDNDNDDDDYYDDNDNDDDNEDNDDVFGGRSSPTAISGAKRSRPGTGRRQKRGYSFSAASLPSHRVSPYSYQNLFSLVGPAVPTSSAHSAASSSSSSFSLESHRNNANTTTDLLTSPYSSNFCGRSISATTTATRDAVLMFPKLKLSPAADDGYKFKLHEHRNSSPNTQAAGGNYIYNTNVETNPTPSPSSSSSASSAPSADRALALQHALSSSSSSAAAPEFSEQCIPRTSFSGPYYSGSRSTLRHHRTPSSSFFSRKPSSLLDSLLRVVTQEINDINDVNDPGSSPDDTVPPVPLSAMLTVKPISLDDYR